MNYYNVLLAKQTNKIEYFGSLYDCLFEKWINRAKQILKDLPTGSISTVNDAAELPLNALKVSVEAVQDLHGYDHPWVGGAGKNLYDKNNANNQPNRRVSTGSGGTYAADGYTATYLLEVEPDTDYTITISPNFVSYICWYDETQTRIDGTGWISGTSMTSPSNAKYARFDFSTADIDAVQFERGSSPTAYEPYENICPIIGWDSGEITVCDDIQSPTQTETTTLDFPQTIYGAEWDVVNGEMKQADGYFEANSIIAYDSQQNACVIASNVPNITTHNSSPIDGISNSFVFEGAKNLFDNLDLDGIAIGENKDCFFRNTNCHSRADYEAWISANPIQVKYKLATPTTIDLSPLSIRLLEGANNLYADCGEILSGKYWANV